MPRSTVYLDYNASAPLLPAARDAMIAAMDIDGNPASVHSGGRAVKALVQKARRHVAELVKAKPDHVVFTSGATEAAATLLTPSYSMGRSPLTLSALHVAASDHPCVLAGGQFPRDKVHATAVDANGLMDLVALDAALSAHDRATGLPLVATHHVNNETGAIQPIAGIAAIVRKHGGVFVVDAVQSAGRLPLDLTALDADYLIISGHKLGGPKGIGAIVAKSDLMMPMPLINGGGQERGHRGGTEATSLIAGFGAAAAHACANIDGFAALADRRDSFIARLKAIDPTITIHAEATDRVCNTVYFTVPGRRAETLQIAADLAGFCVSAGSACSSGKVGKSHVLQAMGVAGDDGAVRISFGSTITDDQLTDYAEHLRSVLHR